MLLTIVRHGETIENRDDICQGQIDGKLSDVGILQAKQVAERLKSEEFDVIFCSDLGRTKETLEPIVKFHKNTPVIYSKEIREKYMGERQGKKHPAKWGDFNIMDVIDNKDDGKESFIELLDRVSGFVKKVQSEYSDKRVLFVTHGGPIHVMLVDLLGYDWQQTYDVKVHNTSVTQINVKEEPPHDVRLLACTKHLS